MTAGVQRILLTPDLFAVAKAPRPDNGWQKTGTIRLGNRGYVPGPAELVDTESGEVLDVEIEWDGIFRVPLSDIPLDCAKRSGFADSEAAVEGVIALYTHLGRKDDDDNDPNPASVITFVGWEAYQR